MNSSRGTHISQQCTGSSCKRCRRAKAPEEAPILQKGSPRHLKRKVSFSSVSLRINGTQLSLPEYQNRDLASTQDLVQTVPSAGRPAASTLCLLALDEKVKLKKQVEKTTTTKNSSNVSFLVYSSCVSSYCFLKETTMNKKHQ